MPSPASNDTQETCPSFIIFCSGYPRYHPCCFAIATAQQISAESLELRCLFSRAEGNGEVVGDAAL